MSLRPRKRVSWRPEIRFISYDYCNRAIGLWLWFARAIRELDSLDGKDYVIAAEVEDAPEDAKQWFWDYHNYYAMVLERQLDEEEGLEDLKKPQPGKGREKVCSVATMPASSVALTSAQVGYRCTVRPRGRQR